MEPTPKPNPIEQLLHISHELGKEERQLSILGEGNTSVRLNEDTFLVKASGGHLGTLTEQGVTECRFDRLLPLLSMEQAMADKDVDEALMAARVDENAPKPSVEALFHAYLLSLPDISYCGHTHPVSVNGILCSGHGFLFATRRTCPDEIVCCDAESVLVPYTDPGMQLAQAIRRKTEEYIQRLARPPRVILLENHGLITLGRTPQAVIAATLMVDKAAKIYLGAASLSSEHLPTFMTAHQVERIAGRPDEDYRRRALNL